MVKIVLAEFANLSIIGVMKCEKCGGKGTLPDPEDLLRLREKSEMAQVTIAMRMKIAPSYLCDLEQGRRDWNADLVSRFIKAIKGKKCL